MSMIEEIREVLEKYGYSATNIEENSYSYWYAKEKKPDLIITGLRKKMRKL